MIPTLQRTYSKAKAIANRVIWTAQEPMPTVYQMDGLLSPGLCGLYRVTGRPVYCAAYQVSFTVPSQDPGLLVQITLVYGNGETIPGTTSKMYGSVANAIKIVTPPALIPAGGIVQFHIDIVSGLEEFLPQDAVLTYYMNFANGLPGATPWP